MFTFNCTHATMPTCDGATRALTFVGLWICVPFFLFLLATLKTKDGEPMVHAGFREAADSISRRLKELLLAAVGGDFSGWEVLVTGHSLGGALATLFTTDLAV
jgi:hypothetical protein